MNIFGITGLARSGKNTTAEYLASKYSLPILSFADPLKEAAVSLFGITEDMAYGFYDYDREQIVPEWGISVREMLQRLGTECMRKEFGEDFWLRRAEQTIKHPVYKNGFILSDIRFDNEAEWIKSKGGTILSIERNLSKQHGHVSEDRINVDLLDYIIPNTNTIPVLYHRLDTLCLTLDKLNERDNCNKEKRVTG